MGRLVFGVLTMAPERRMPKIALAEPLLEQVDKKAEFKRWLVLFFIQRGQFKITDNGYAELAPQVQRQSLEFGEPVSNRTREPRMEERRGLTKKEIKELVSRRVEEMLAEGKTEELYTRGLIDRQKKFDWKDKEVRMIVIKQLLKILGKKPVDVDHDDFKSCGLDGFLKSRYNDSPYLALIEAGYAYSLDEVKEHGKTGKFKTDRIYPWEITKTPRIYDDKEIRIAATKWLLWKLKIEPRKITTTVFRKNGARGVTAYCNGSPYLALIEAGYAYSLDEVKEHGKTGKFKTDKIYPWEITKTPGVYDNKEIRIAATKWLVLKSGKQPREVTGYDFDNGSLICRPEYNGSHYLALLEAGLVTQKDEAYMRSHANKT